MVSPLATRPRQSPKRLAATLLVLGLGSAVAHAMPQDSSISQMVNRNFTVADGLPQHSVQDILQTSDGYLWFATQEGLARFDGKRFDVFDSGNTSAFRNSLVIRLAECPDGVLWVGTEIGLIAFENGEFRLIGADDEFLRSRIGLLACTGDGVLWIGTNRGLARLAPGASRVEPAPFDLPSPNVNALHVDASGALWVGTAEGLLLADNKEHRIWQARDDLPGNVVTDVLSLADGTVYVATTAGLASIHDDTVTHVYPPSGSLFVNRLELDTDGALWIGTNDQGLLRLRDGRVDTWNQSNGAPSNLVRALHRDREGNMWIGFGASGVTRLSNGVFTSWSRHEGLSHDHVYSVFSSSDGSIWIGTFGAGLNRLRDGRITVYDERDGLASKNIWTMAESTDGTLWVSTYGGGLHRYRDGRFERLHESSGLSSRYVRTLLVDGNGTLWAGTRDNGLFRSTDGEHFDSLRDEYPAVSISALHQDPNGDIWIGTYDQSIARYHQGQFTRFDAGDGLPQVRVYDIFRDSAGTLWLGTHGAGLVRFKDGRFQSLGRNLGLFDDVVYQILDDNLGYLWMNSNRGVFNARIEDLNDVLDGELERVESRSFGTNDGMKSSETNGGSNPSAARSPDGALWFPTLAGATRVLPRLAHAQEFPEPPVHIESLHADDQAVKLEEAVVPAGTSRIHVGYTALSYRPASADIRFRYRLTGFNDDRWIDAGNRRELFLTNLAPGDYRLDIAATYPGGRWNTEPAQLRFRVLPHFWQATWFSLLVLLALLALAWSAHRVNIYRLLKQQRKLEMEVEHKTAELRVALQTVTELSEHDHLTGLFNRRYFDEALDIEWRRASRSGEAVSVVMVDVDHFKQFNDRYGHLEGDRCLRAIAGVLQTVSKRAGDVAARFGGEEFALVLPYMDEAHLTQVGELICKRVRELQICNDMGAQNRMVSVSVGMALAVPAPNRQPADLLKAADTALYAAKNAGRDRARFAAR